MVDAGPAGEGKRRGKKNRGGRPGSNSKKKRSKGRGGGNRKYQQGSYLPDPVRDDSSILGSRPLPTQQPVQVEHEEGPPDAFRLFCAYHLGVTVDDGYQKPRTDEVARRFGVTIEEVKKLLVEFGLDDKSLREIHFDLEGAKIDIRVAPPGISKTEVAREHFEELLEMKQVAQTE